MATDWSLEPGYTTTTLDDGTPIWNVMTYKDKVYPPFEDGFVRRMDDIRQNFKLRTSDIFILGYMKSGTHWLWEVLNMLLHKHANVDEENGKTDGFLEMSSCIDLENMRDPRIINSHLAPNLLPESIWNNKVLVPIRNPKDTAVSMFHHQVAEKNGADLRCGWHRFIIDVWHSPKHMIYETWFDYTATMWRLSKEKNTIHPVIYEQMIKEPVKVIRKLADFLELQMTDSDIQSIAEATQFENMSKLKMKSQKIYETTFHEGYTMFRKGKVGDWKSQFTVFENEVFDDRLAEGVSVHQEMSDLMDKFYELDCL